MNIKTWTDKKTMKGAEPIFLPGNKKTGVLLFHGWTSSPQEFNPDYTPSTAKYLNELGYTVYVPLRLGHGTTPEDFSKLRWEDWLEDAKDHYRLFSNECEGVVVGGMSMGASLALHIASENPIAGVMPMGTPIFMKMHWLFVPWALLSRHNYRMRHKRYLPKDQEIAAKKIHYTQYPNHHIFENLKASRETRKILPAIKAPALILHSADDNIAHPRSAKYIYNHISSTDKKIVLIKDSYHSFTTDRNAKVASEAMGEFLGKIDT
ncbi:MAG: alpha/beta fold hydrolase [Candidatus Colwellbacteria bacterium]